MAVQSLDELRQLKPQIEALTARYGLSNLRVFGSIVRGELTETSDVDFLAEWQEKLSLWSLFDCRYQLEDMLGRKVEIVDPRYIRYHHMRDHILSEALPL